MKLLYSELNTLSQLGFSEKQADKRFKCRSLYAKTPQEAQKKGNVENNTGRGRKIYLMAS